MKFRLLILSVLSMVLTTSINAQSTNGLIAHWDFNGNVNDQSGNGLNGTPTNITYTTGSSGISNTAAVFNGSTSFISTPYKSVLNITAFTICATVKVKTFNTNTCQESVIVATGMFPTSGGYGLTMGDNPFDNDDCNYYDTSKQIFRCHAGSAHLPATTWQYTPTARTNRWYNVVGIYDGTNYKIYIDGILVKSAPSVSGSFTGNTNQPVYIGRNPAVSSGIYGYWFDGEIDDIKIYNRVLSDSERNICCTPTSSITFDGVIEDTLLCRGSNFNINFNTSNSYMPGNVFSAELSDVTGAFTSPTVIGTLTSQTSGTIACTIPISTPVGNKYRVRVVSSSPYDESADNGTDIRIVSTISPSVSIAASPSANVGPLTPITFTATPVNAGARPTYVWLKNGIAIPGATGNTYVGVTNVDFVSGDQISVYMTSGLTCAEPSNVNSNTISINVDLSVNGLALLNNAFVYPNPNNGTFTIKGQINSNKEVRINVIDAIGRTVYKGAVTPNGYELNETINVSRELPTGTYMLQLQSDDAVSTLRFTIYH